jgi:hypothetical protein
MSEYNWVRHPDGDQNQRLHDVGINADGTLHNPNGYPEEIVRAAVLAADARRHARRSESAKKAAETRKRRQQGTPSLDICAVCGTGPTNIITAGMSFHEACHKSKAGQGLIHRYYYGEAP